MISPIYQEIVYFDPSLIFSNFANQSGAILLESAQLMQDCGRYSFIAIDPFRVMSCKNGEITLDTEKVIADPFLILKTQMSQFRLVNHESLPPFQGGVAGCFSYDMFQYLENINVKQHDDMEFPDLALGFYDVVIAFDHILKRAWVFSSGYPEIQEAKRVKRAQERLGAILAEIKKTKYSPNLENEMQIKSNFDEEKYCQAVQKAKEYILAGDIFEVNISQRFEAFFPESIAAYDLYLELRLTNPAPFSAYLNFENFSLVSASPERFIQLVDKKVETRPIKGTIKRGSTPVEDKVLSQRLLKSEKDVSENVMIVDLLRNDLSKVCEDHSVKVTQLCGLESYASVHHLVSVVAGILKSEKDAIDLLCATFPGGSITGAPKIRAMEIIAEIEPTKRGPYCGAIGYIGFNGDMDTSIVIRTYAIKNRKITFQAGGAVVLDSNPIDEYRETLIKAKALQRVLLHDFAY